jgi:hypothetical protein
MLSDRPRTSLARLLVASVALSATGCGDSEHASSTHHATFAEPKTAGIQQGAYDDSFDVCKGLGIKEIRRQIGGGKDIASVANAYAADSYIEGVRVSSAKGCLAGMLKHGK